MDDAGAARPIPDPGFAGDDGSAPPTLLAALVDGEPSLVVAALLSARVLVPVVAVLGEVEVDASGRARDKTSDMAVVTIRAPDGRRALPVFTSTVTLEAWNPAARPVPVHGVQAARAAYAEDADTLLLDPGSRHLMGLAGPALRALAEGRALLPPADDPEVHAAITAAVDASGLSADAVTVEAGTDTDLVVVLQLDPPPDAAVVATLRRLSERLAGDPVLGARLGRGLDLKVLGDPG